MHQFWCWYFNKFPWHFYCHHLIPAAISIVFYRWPTGVKIPFLLLLPISVSKFSYVFLPAVFSYTLYISELMCNMSFFYLFRFYLCDIYIVMCVHVSYYLLVRMLDILYTSLTGLLIYQLESVYIKIQVKICYFFIPPSMNLPESVFVRSIFRCPSYITMSS